MPWPWSGDALNWLGLMDDEDDEDDDEDDVVVVVVHVVVVVVVVVALPTNHTRIILG